ncbi:unnamed protein product [Macrosiphum euphorbiae]|uniref:Uncharacterized protein n=1 Tax=Macrosiphum euphorbiae TaxID=13131 RepID=A0AAV0Y4T3_9HEMI|nr:unnamed protein product [Macrosiphum euphorbiae]
MGEHDDHEAEPYDPTVSTDAQKYDDLIERIGRELASKFVSGIHRYVSRIIVPGGVGGVQKCLFELDRLIEMYPPSHFYIISVTAVNRQNIRQIYQQDSLIS